MPALNGGFQQGAWGLVINAGPVAKTILLILFMFSVVSWAIVVQKLISFRRIYRESQKFLDFFRSDADISDIRRAYRQFRNSPLFRLFERGYRRIQKNRQVSYRNSKRADGPYPEFLQEDRKTIEDALQIEASAEILKMEQYMGFLATTASVSPFFGLLGTVWGVMIAFINIGQRGSASIGVVAPGIAEALITTIAGLATAIPAVIAYNYFLGKLEGVRNLMEEFAFEFVCSLLEEPKP